MFVITYQYLIYIMNRIIYLLLCLIAQQTFAQSSDVILLKRNSKTIKRYFAGTNIDLTTKTGVYLSAEIEKIKNDTLFLKQYDIRQIPTQLGVYILDTVATYHYKYHYNDVYAIGRNKKGFNMSGSAATLLGGGMLLTVANGIVFLADRKKFSPGFMIVSASLAGLGYLMAKTGGKGMVIGKKYSFVYLAIAENKKS